MDNFTPLKIKSKKNFKKILIFGNLILVVLIAVIGVVYYNRTLLTTQQKAVAPGACVCNDSKGKAVPGSCSGGSCDCGALEVRNDRCGETSGGGQPGQQNNEQSCDNSGGHWCEVWDINGKKHNFCAGRTEGCQNAAVDQGITMQTGGGGPGLGGWRCIIGQNNYTGGSCDSRNYAQVVGTGKPPSCFCGIIQIDGGEWNGTYQSNCGCNKEEETAMAASTPVGTIIPTPSDIPNATPTDTLIAVIPTTAPTEVPTKVPTEIPTGVPTNSPTPTPTTPAGQPTNTPGPTATPTVTKAAIPVSGRSPWWIFVIPSFIILGSLIL